MLKGRPVYIVERDDGDVIAVCDNENVANQISTLANELETDDGDRNVSSLVTRWIMNEVPDFLIHRTYYVMVDGDNATAKLVEFEEDYSIGILEKQAKTGVYTSFVHADRERDAIIKVYDMIDRELNRVKRKGEK